MHLPWKKVKTARISQFVNDHIHKSQKRRDGSSLVVETGFPTSLVDLFIKNREKLKKPSKRKRQRDPEMARSNASSHSISPEIPPGGTFSSLRVPPNSPQPLPRDVLVENFVMRSNDEDSDERECIAEARVDVNTVLLVVLKMFFVVILALGTKRLTVGITLSAFLLFFLDYMGKHPPVVLNPYLRNKGVLKTGVFGVLKLLRLKDVNLEQDKLLKPDGSRDEVQEEIQVMESRHYLVKHVFEEIQPEDEITEEGSSQKTSFGHRKIKYEEVVLMGIGESGRKSRKVNMKLKMKKFIQKKLRGTGKEHGPERADEIVREDNIVFLDVGQMGSCELERGLDTTSEIPLFKEVEKTSVSCDSGELIPNKVDKGDKLKGGGLTWKHIVLCVIVLAGLIRGRALAFILTLSWFLLLKLGEISHMWMKVCL